MDDNKTRNETMNIITSIFPWVSLCLQELATKRIREHPTLPPRESLDTVDAGEVWPSAFCAFAGCAWEELHGTEGDLNQHLQAHHAHELKPICERMLRGKESDAMRSVYCQAIAMKCRDQAPVAGTSLDRMALRGFAEATAGNKVEALVCFCCGGIHPYVEEVASKGSIQWHQPLRQEGSNGKLLFLGQPLAKIESLIGLQTYLTRYNAVEPRPQTRLTDHESFEDWRLRLPELEDGVLLCCPEDIGVKQSAPVNF